MRAQNKEAYNWYFGNNAAINFETPNLSPQNITGSQMDQIEGCACISTPNGRLLFYTNGQEVWDSTNNIMPNGSGLDGHQSACQSGVIVPLPGNSNLFYIFTVTEDIGYPGVCYSVVDMTLNNGLGDISPSIKNQVLIGPSEEKVTAVKASNNMDYWVVTHTWNSSNFYAYKIDEDGLHETPVISTTGLYHAGVAGLTHSSMKFSPDGTKLAIVVRQENSIELFDFNNGQVSNPVLFPSLSSTNPYGIEFSPLGDKLYVSAYGGSAKVFQFDISSRDSSIMVNTCIEIANSSSTFIGALQTAPDGKIYVARRNSAYLGLINFPEKDGLLCNYIDNGHHLGNATPNPQSQFGLPTFIQSYFYNPGFTHTNNCYLDTTLFSVIETAGVDSSLWDFGDPTSGSLNLGNGFEVSHIYSNPGIYTVALTNYSGGMAGTKNQTIEIFALPYPNLGPDIELCNNENMTLYPGAFAHYFWSTGAQASSISISSGGSYSVTVQNIHLCENSDTVFVLDLPAPTNIPIIYHD